MIDLSKYADRTVDFKIDGELVRVQELSHTLYRKVVAYEAEPASAESFDKRTELILEMLNRNTSGKEFKLADLDKMPEGALNRIYQEVVYLSRKALTDPN